VDNGNKKIVFLSHFDANLYLFRLPLMKALKEKGWSVYALVPEGEYSSGFKNFGIMHIKYNIDRGSLNPLSEIKTIFEISKKLKEIKPDIIHTFTAKPNIYGTIAAKISGNKNIICSVTGLGSFFIENDFKSKLIKNIILILYKIVFRYSWRVIFQNSDDLKLFVNKKIINKNKALLIKGSGVDTSFYQSNKDPSKNPKKILFIGRLLVHKGIKEFIEAAKIIKKEFGKKVEFVVVGDFYDGNPYNVDKDYFFEAVSQKAITFAGWQKDVKKFLEECYIFVLPSYREGLPRTALEAASMSRPIITTKTIGCKESVDDGYNGFLVDIKDAKTIAKKIKTLLSNETLYKKMSQNSRLKAKNEFDAKIVVNEHLKIYNTL